MAYEQDYYKKLQEEDYKALLGSEQQLDAARRRALKNTQTQLDAMGMGSAGYGSTVRTGIESQYQQGLMNAQDQYRADVQYHQEQADQASAGEMQDYLTQLGIYQNDNDALYNRLMQDQYGSYGEDGKWVWNEEKLSTLNPKDVEMLKNGVTTLDYTNAAGNRDVIGKFVLDQIGTLDTSDFNYLNNLYKTLQSAGIIVTQDGKTSLDLSKVDKQSGLYIEQLVNQYDLLSGKYNGQSVNTNDYFAMAEFLGKDDPNYNAYMSLGYTNNYTSAMSANKTVKEKTGQDFKISYQGKSYKVEVGDAASSTTSRSLNSIYGSKKSGDIVYYDGELYIKTSNGSWYVVRNRNTTDMSVEKLKKLMGIE